jgi:hypothetical protein
MLAITVFVDSKLLFVRLFFYLAGISSLHVCSFVCVSFANEDSFAFYRNLHCTMSTQPQFFAIDDDLKDPSEAMLAFHQQYLTRFMRQYWVRPAEWELTHLDGTSIPGEDDVKMDFGLYPPIGCDS